MYENATTIQFQPGTVDKALFALRAHVVPILREQAGLLSLCLIPDHKTSRITVISLWISRAHALAVEATCAYRKEIKKLDHLLNDDSLCSINSSSSSKSVDHWPFATN